jgi:tetratricopeptide (TPR) repeat protein
VEYLQGLFDWLWTFIAWLSGSQPAAWVKNAVQWIVVIGSAVAIGYKAVQWLRGERAATRKDIRSLKDEAATKGDIENLKTQLEFGLAHEAWERGRLEGMQKAFTALSQTDGHVRALTQAIEELRQEKSQESSEIEQALTMLHEGKTEAAEMLFTRIGEAKAAQGVAMNKEAAYAFRNLGNIAFSYDTQKAMHAYTRATKLDPGNPEGWNRLGELQFRIGELEKAVRSFERALGNRIEDQK